MKTLDPVVLLAIFHEMIGPLLWLVIAGSAITTAVFIVLLIRDRGLVSRRFVGSEVAGVAGGFGAVAFMWLVTHSGPGDLGGPVDWLLVATIWLAGAGGTTVLVYVLWSVVGGRRRDAHDLT